MKASDISDEMFLGLVKKHGSGPAHWCQSWDLLPALDEAMGVEVPAKVMRAKAKRLIQAKKLNGCYCGCRGDFVLPEDDVSGRVASP